MKKAAFVTCVGEALVDFVASSSEGLMNAPSFLKTVGGEGANVAVGLARLGTRTAFIGRVGNDAFGAFLIRALHEAGVRTRQMIKDEQYKTRLAFVSLTRDGERDFAFWEKDPAGERLRIHDVQMRSVVTSSIINIAPLLLVREPARKTAFYVARAAHSKRCQVAFDANVRLSLWKSAGDARRVLLRMIRMCTMLRLNADEARFLTGLRDVRRAAARLLAIGPQLVVVTRGPEGCYFRTEHGEGAIPGFRVKPVDTTGCGDGFFAALIHGIAKNKGRVRDVPRNEITRICRFANAVGALVSLKRGGAASMPTQREVRAFLASHPTFSSSLDEVGPLQ